VNIIDRRTLAVLFTALMFAAALWIAWAARRPLVAALFAVLFAYLLEPVVAFVQRHAGGTRVRAIAVTYLTAFAILMVAILAAAPRISDEVTSISQSAPSYVAQVRSGVIARTIGARFGWSTETTTAVQDWVEGHADAVAAFVQAIGARLAEVSTNIGWLVLIPILAFFFLKDKATLSDMIVAAAGGGRGGVFAQRLIVDLDRMVARYIRAQMLYALCGLVAYTTFLAIIGFPNALGFGVLGGVLEFIPFIGPAMTAVVLFVVGFFGGYAHWAVVLAFLGVWRLVQDYVTSPHLMGEGLELHPAVTILGVLIGGELAGVPGMFLSIPVIAALRIVWRNWRSLDDQESLRESSRNLRIP
jgi:predicted PurR-regulated permease PerM